RRKGAKNSCDLPSRNEGRFRKAAFRCFSMASLRLCVSLPASAFRAHAIVLTSIALALSIAAKPAQCSAQADPDQRTESSTTIAPPSNLTAKDHPNDDGTAIDLEWKLSPDDDPKRTPRVVRGYKIIRSLASGEEHEELPHVAYNVDDYTDR